jgi:tetratricopeptide (TPR) repeat protein
MKARLQRISAPSRRMLEIAAVIGRSFSADLLREAARATDASTVRAILELSDRRLIVERPERRDYMFTHQLLQSAAYELIPPAERREVHLRVAETIEAGSASLDEAAPLLAAHFERAHDDQRAAAYHLRAARHTLTLNADSETRYHCERCLALSADRTIRSEALFIRETVHRRAGESAAQRADLDELAELQSDGSDTDRALEVLRRKAALCHAIGDRGGETSQIATMRRRAAELASAKWNAHALHAEGRQCLATGRIEAARTALEDALSDAERAGEALLSAEICSDLALVEEHAGFYVVAEAYSERAQRVAREHWSEELALKIAPQMYGLPHQIETPERTYRVSRDLLQRAIAMGDQHEEMETRLRAGTAAMTLFRISEADEQLRLAAHLAERLGTPKWRCNIAVSRGVLSYCMGDFETAQAHIEHAKEVATAAGDRFTELLCEVDSAYVALGAGDAQSAIDRMDACGELVADVGSEMLTAAARCIRGSAMCRLGLPGGLEELERGVAGQRELSRDAMFGNDLAELALAYVAHGNVPAAVELAGDLARLSEMTYCGVAHPELMLLAAARAWEAAGDHDRSHDLLARAREKLRQHADQIDDPRLKESFLAMSFNRELVDDHFLGDGENVPLTK